MVAGRSAGWADGRTDGRGHWTRGRSAFLPPFFPSFLATLADTIDLPVHAQLSSTLLRSLLPLLPSQFPPASSRSYFNVVSLDYFYLADRATDCSGGGGGGGGGGEGGGEGTVGEVGESAAAAAANHNCPSVRLPPPLSPLASSPLHRRLSATPPLIPVARPPAAPASSLYRGMARGAEEMAFHYKWTIPLQCHGEWIALPSRRDVAVAFLNSLASAVYSPESRKHGKPSATTYRRRRRQRQTCTIWVGPACLLV